MKFETWIENKEYLESLPKFLTAKEILARVSLEDHDDLSGRFASAQGDDEKLLQLKYKNAEKRGLLDNVVEKGILNPLEIHVDNNEEQTLTDGHHRLAIALKHFPNKPLPVKYWTG